MNTSFNRWENQSSLSSTDYQEFLKKLTEEIAIGELMSSMDYVLLYFSGLELLIIPKEFVISEQSSIQVNYSTMINSSRTGSTSADTTKNKDFFQGTLDFSDLSLRDSQKDSKISIEGSMKMDIVQISISIPVTSAFFYTKHLALKEICKKTFRQFKEPDHLSGQFLDIAKNHLIPCMYVGIEEYLSKAVIIDLNYHLETSESICRLELSLADISSQEFEAKKEAQKALKKSLPLA